MGPRLHGLLVPLFEGDYLSDSINENRNGDGNAQHNGARLAEAG